MWSGKSAQEVDVIWESALDHGVTCLPASAGRKQVPVIRDFNHIPFLRPRIVFIMEGHSC